MGDKGPEYVLSGRPTIVGNAAEDLIVSQVDGEAHPRAVMKADGSIVTGDGTSYPSASASTHPTINSQTGTTYTLVLADDGKIVEANNAAAITLTVPPNTDVAFPLGTLIEVYQQGAGQVTIAAGAGVTLRTPNGAKTAKQYSTVGLRKRDTDTWVVSGDTSL